MDMLSILLVFGGLAVLIPINIPIYRAIFKMFFRSKEEFKQSLQYLFMSDIMTIMQGKLCYDLKMELKTQGFFVLCLMIFMVEVQVLEKLFYLLV